MDDAHRVALNRQYQRLLGWTPADLGGTTNDQTLLAPIRGVQEAAGVTVDGVCGPATYEAVLRQQRTALKVPQAPGDRLVNAGRLALVEAKLLWLGKVIDPPDRSSQYAASRQVIDDLIRSSDGIGWDWEAPYRQNGDFEWCGTLAAWGWRSAGLTLPLRKLYFPSTYRLDRYARYASVNGEPPSAKPATGRRKLLELDESSGPEAALYAADDPPRAGDILLVGPEKSGYGKHICLVESYDLERGLFATIEGNGTGAWPSGGRVHGIVRNLRPVGLGRDDPPTRYHPRRLIRPSVSDLA